jgi:3-phosphoshikimate 1-carboxyvinyltransferase
MARNSLTKIITPAKQLKGVVNLPGDKSICHRVALFGSLASGTSIISNFSPGKDCSSTLSCLKALGVPISRKPDNIVRVHGAGRSGFTEPNNVLNAGNSGTTTRLLSGILAAQPFLSVVTGDASLRSRPMRRLIEPLRSMGADVEGRRQGSFAPLVIKGKKLHGTTYTLPVPSAQIKSAILLAGLFAEGKTIVKQNQISRDHTERLLKQMGAQIEIAGNDVILTPDNNTLTQVEMCVPGDISSAAYWLVAGAIHPDARIKIMNCGNNPTRTGILDILKEMGAKITIENQRSEYSEPVADLFIESSKLSGVEIKGEIIPKLIDEIPILAVAACFARGTTVIKDAAELRVKESDRIATTVKELSALGAQIEELPDGMKIVGGSKLLGTRVKSYFDHRLAMSLAIAGLTAQGKTTIENAHCVDISYPQFWEQLEALTVNK